ncbi:MAG: membrane protein [Nitrospiraceae bacterium]|nr:MAG: membrane protein [Nitrospiraceae bacterium]
MITVRAALKRYFLTGLLVITPIWGTVLILKTLFVTVDGILGDMLARVVTPGYYVPGLGIATLVLLIFATGLFAANFIGRQIVALWEDLLNRVPVVRGIYSTLKSMMDILSFTERGQYNRVVLIQFPKNGHYCFAFVTGVTKGEVQDLSSDPLVHVYVPTSPNPTSGYFLLVPEREVIPVEISVEEAMKLIVSGGLYSPTPSMGATLGADSKWSKVKQPEAGVPIA